jgi:hypothetical protein
MMAASTAPRLDLLSMLTLLEPGRRDAEPDRR